MRANYTILKDGINETTESLELFIRNLLLNEKNELKNRYLHINSQIEHKNGAIEEQISYTGFNVQTRNHVKRLYEKFWVENVFGRNDVAEICGLSYSAEGKLIGKLKEKSLIKMLKDLEKEGIVLNYKSGVLKGGKRIY